MPESKGGERLTVAQGIARDNAARGPGAGNLEKVIPNASTINLNAVKEELKKTKPGKH